MMELQWGGVRRERRVSMFFTEKLPVLFARARSGGATSNNKPTRGRWEEGCRLHVSPGRSRLPTRLRAWEGDSVDGSGKIKYHCACVVCTMLCSQEDEIKKSANVRALPGGGGML